MNATIYIFCIYFCVWVCESVCVCVCVCERERQREREKERVFVQKALNKKLKLFMKALLTLQQSSERPASWRFTGSYSTVSDLYDGVFLFILGI